MQSMECPLCEGARLNKTALAVTIEGNNINTITSLPLKNLAPWLDSLKQDSKSEHPDKLSDQEKEIVKQVVKEIGF